MTHRSSPQLASLAAAKRDFGPGSATRTERLLAGFRGAKFRDVESLLHFHDALLFLRAFPQSRRVAKMAERLLRAVEDHVKQLASSDADMSLFDSEEYSGVVGTVIRNAWTFELARWLMKRRPDEITAEWDLEEQSRRMAIILPNVLPLLEDDSFVEPDTPFIEMMSLAAGGDDRVLPWLLESFDRLSVPLLQKTDLYDALDVELIWSLDRSTASRTLARRPAPRLFFHREPLLQRRQVSLPEEMQAEPLPLRKLPAEEGQELLDFVREALAVRYRELHGTTHGESRSVYEADPGRGVLLYLWGVDQDWRLPLRAYYAGMTLKNGVPINYFESIGMFEWLELGFNTFYAFREGETAWIYSKVIHLLHQVAGATCISVYPYQLGHENEEAIASGAFWFYRKLGFRPGKADLLALTEREEAKMARNPKHRTAPRILRQLAAGHVFFEFGEARRGLWDTFSTRNIERAVLRHMAERFKGEAPAMRLITANHLADVLKVDLSKWNSLERQAFTNFACVLSLVSKLNSWSVDEKQLLIDIIRAKAAVEESRYLRLMRRHAKLKEALLKLGSAPI